MNLKKLILLLFSLSPFIIQPAAAEDCAKAETLLNQAMADKNLTSRIETLKQSANLCKADIISYNLGTAWMEKGFATVQQGDDGSADLARAQQRFREAAELTEQPAILAKIWIQRGRIEEMKGNLSTAITCYENAQKYEKRPQVSQYLETLYFQRASQIVPAEEICSTLSTESQKAFGVRGLPLPVQFDNDKATLNSAGLAQAEEVGRALTSGASFSEKTITLIGHTSLSGTEEHNQKLSERRAVAVKAFLIKQYALKAENIVTVGKGESAPLIAGESSKANTINRRVEIKRGR